MANNSIKKNSFGLVILSIIIALTLSGLYAEWLWFDSLNYLSVFKTVLFSKVALGSAVFLMFFAFLLLNFTILKRKVNVTIKKIYLTAILVVSLLAGFISSASWFTVLRFINYVNFGFVDPIFKTDIGFYIFVLPFYHFVLNMLLFLLIAIIVMTIAGYLLTTKTKKAPKQDIKEEMPFGFKQPFQQIKIGIPKKGRTHLAFLAGLILIIFAAFFYLKRYSILFSSGGAVFGAGYTDIAITLPLYMILTVITLITALIAFAYIYNQNTKILLGSIALILIVSFGGNIVAAVVQSLYVQPNEFNLEEPYIEQNIKHTLFAYGLTNVYTR
ncbi:MAG: UPF0182 family protein, partial [Candidatus Woesearchaeota archaeon]